MIGSAPCSSSSVDLRTKITVDRKRKALEAAINSCSKSWSPAIGKKEPVDTKRLKQHDLENKASTDVREQARRLLIEEAKRAAARAEKIGPEGWKKPPCLRTNKEFLTRTLKSTLRQRRRSPAANRSSKI